WFSEQLLQLSAQLADLEWLLQSASDKKDLDLRPLSPDLPRKRQFIHARQLDTAEQNVDDTFRPAGQLQRFTKVRGNQHLIIPLQHLSQQVAYKNLVSRDENELWVLAG